MHIAIEGMDGVGKTSAAKLLAKRLKMQYYSKTFHAMRDTCGHYDNFIALNDYVGQLSNHFNFGLRGAFLYCKLNGIDVVSDRYFVSNFWAHTHGHHYDELKSTIELLGEPDITFLLYGEQEIIRRRMLGRNPYDKDIVKIDYIPQAYVVMKEFLARTGLKNVVIDTSRCSLEEVVDLMVAIVREGETFDFTGHHEICTIVAPRHETNIVSQQGFKLTIRNHELRECIGQGSHLEIPSGIKRIDNHAFAKCPQLKELHIPATVECIAEQAFDVCGELTEIAVAPDNLKYQAIDQHLFTKDCQTLLQYAIGRKEKTYYLPDGTNKIGITAFKGCQHLKRVKLNPGIKSIGFASFLGCTALSDINIPATLEWIGKLAFLQCVSLTNMTIDQANPYYSKKGQLLLSGAGQAVKHVLQGVSQEELLVPPVKKADVWAFAHWSGSESVVLPEGLTQIAAYCFMQSEVRFVHIPRSIEEIGDMGFYGCQKMKTIHFAGHCPPRLGQDALANLPPQAVISIPRNSRLLFLAEKAWKALDYRLTERDTVE
jgi:thymidylate kinase